MLSETAKPSAAISSGFTLVELIIVLAIVAILLTVATPNYESMIIDSKVDKARYALASSLAFARTEAVKRGEDISVCKGTADGACGSGTGSTAWSSAGWKVYLASGNEVLRRDQSENEGVTITYECGDLITFNSDGERSSSTGDDNCVFKFADSGGDTSYDKCLYVNFVGRVRMAATGDTDCDSL